MSTPRDTRFHRDGTVTYWSVYEQRWVERAWLVPARELAALSARERERVERHLEPICECGDAHCTRGQHQDGDQDW